MTDEVDMKEIDLKMSGENSQAAEKKLIYCSDGQIDEDELLSEGLIFYGYWYSSGLLCIGKIPGIPTFKTVKKLH